MSLLNSHQPVRSRHHPIRDLVLRYRTFPEMSNKRPIKITDPRSMIAQARLYRFVRSGDMENGIAISDLHDHLFYDVPLITKKIMGMTVVQTVIYNPRLLLGQSKLNDKNRVIYRFNDLLDFQYGLEWQICTWLRKFLNDTSAPGAPDVLGPDMVAEELDILTSTNLENYNEIYEEILWNFNMKEPDWVTLVSGRMEEIPMIMTGLRDQKPRSPVPKSRISASPQPD